MSDFPASKKTFTQLVDGTDYTEATQVNQAYDEVEAVETLIGAMGRDQSYNTSLKALLKNYRAGCACVYKSATELTVQTGEIYIPDASGNGAYRQNTSDVTVTWAMIDTGAEEASTTYYVYAVADSAATTFTVVFSKSATAPTGLTYFRKIGSFYNDGSSNIVNVANTLMNKEILQILDYGTSASDSTDVTNGRLKICFGNLTTSGGSGSVSNLPFTSAASYRVTLSGGYADFYHVSAQSASGFTVTCSNGGTRNANWIAIGT